MLEKVLNEVKTENLTLEEIISRVNDKRKSTIEKIRNVLNAWAETTRELADKDRIVVEDDEYNNEVIYIETKSSSIYKIYRDDFFFEDFRSEEKLDLERLHRKELGILLDKLIKAIEVYKNKLKAELEK